jgi:O-methyltransferase
MGGPRPPATVWLADSFQGVPRSDPENYKADKGIRLDRFAAVLGVSESDVRANFERYGLLDDRVRSLPGWFKDTLQDAPIERISVLRLDGDLYESTVQAPRRAISETVTRRLLHRR